MANKAPRARRAGSAERAAQHRARDGWRGAWRPSARVRTGPLPRPPAHNPPPCARPARPLPGWGRGRERDYPRGSGRGGEGSAGRGREYGAERERERGKTLGGAGLEIGRAARQDFGRRPAARRPAARPPAARRPAARPPAARPPAARRPAARRPAARRPAARRPAARRPAARRPAARRPACGPGPARSRSGPDQSRPARVRAAQQGGRGRPAILGGPRSSSRRDGPPHAAGHPAGPARHDPPGGGAPPRARPPPPRARIRVPAAPRGQPDANVWMSPSHRGRRRRSCGC
jgi:hypothetical protein